MKVSIACMHMLIFASQGNQVHFVPYVPLAEGLFVNQISHCSVSLDAGNFHCIQSNYLLQNSLCIKGTVSIEKYCDYQKRVVVNI